VIQTQSDLLGPIRPTAPKRPTLMRTPAMAPPPRSRAPRAARPSSWRWTGAGQARSQQ
jgi:hypothetical protein